MKKIIVGCTCILSATILYGLRYVTASLLCIGNSIRGGNTDIGQALQWVGVRPNLIAVFLFVVGIVFIILGLKEKN